MNETHTSDYVFSLNQEIERRREEESRLKHLCDIRDREIDRHVRNAEGYQKRIDSLETTVMELKGRLERSAAFATELQAQKAALMEVIEALR